ncbi:uncharacterized protein LOC116221383 [Clupea harengus]|uniref:Uncharacterized protein LOC116221383 n=1 Tax=Clupea harengus TaxID=7950 RepID=A0A6P8FLN1_CLUHA|nr:uncharacterized protein LOC116221383 [Clupea harengus]
MMCLHPQQEVVVQVSDYVQPLRKTQVAGLLNKIKTQAAGILNKIKTQAAGLLNKIKDTAPLTMSPLWVLSMVFTITDSVDVIKAARGSSVHLPCEPTFQEYDFVHVKWRKSGLVNPICEYSLNLTYVNPKHCLPSFKPSLHGLNVAHFKNSHSGSYSCLTTRIIPPPTEDIYNTTMELHSMEGPSLELEQVNTTNADCVQLLCTLDDINQEQVDFIWNINGQNTSGQVQVINSSFNVSSSLRLCGSEWRDGDTITCSVSHLSGHITSSRIIPAQKGSNNWLVIICICAVTGAVLFIIIALIIYKCKKRTKPIDASLVYTNKVYENFSFGSRIPVRQRTETPREQCVYEN